MASQNWGTWLERRSDFDILDSIAWIRHTWVIAEHNSRNTCSLDYTILCDRHSRVWIGQLWSYEITQRERDWHRRERERQTRLNLRWEWRLMRSGTSRRREGLVWSGWLWIITIVIFENNNRAMMCRWIQGGIRRRTGKRRWSWLDGTPKYDCWFSHRSIDENVKNENKNNDMTIRYNARKYKFTNRFFFCPDNKSFSHLNNLLFLFFSLSRHHLLSTTIYESVQVNRSADWIRHAHREIRNGDDECVPLSLLTECSSIDGQRNNRRILFLLAREKTNNSTRHDVHLFVRRYALTGTISALSTNTKWFVKQTKRPERERERKIRAYTLLLNNSFPKEWDNGKIRDQRAEKRKNNKNNNNKRMHLSW